MTSKEAVKNYIQERLIESSVPFWDPVKKLNLFTFSSGNKPLKISRKSEPVIILKKHQNLFSRLITVSMSREIDLKDVLAHELSAVPLSIFHPTGEMRKTNKSQLLKELVGETIESIQYLINEIKDNSATIIDFMAIVQSLNKSGLVTFEDLANRLESAVLSSLKESNTLALVPDRYDVVNSIKSDERFRRQKTDTPVFDIGSDNQKLPKNIASYLGNLHNKKNLVDYLFAKWEVSITMKLNSNQVVYLAKMDGSSTKVTNNGSSAIALVSDHEEADSKIFVYCYYLNIEQQLP